MTKIDPNQAETEARDARRERELAARRVATVVIPARLGSTRFPGKVLAADTGRPMVAHVYQAAINSKAVHRVVIATDDKKVLQAVRDFGGEAGARERDDGAARQFRLGDVRHQLERARLDALRGDRDRGVLTRTLRRALHERTQVR